MAGVRQADRQTEDRRATELWEHILRLFACPQSFCSAPNIITLLGHVVYSSACLEVRYEDSLSAGGCVRHMEPKKRKRGIHLHTPYASCKKSICDLPSLDYGDECGSCCRVL